MVPEGHGDSENRRNHPGVGHGMREHTDTGAPELSVAWGEANERPRDPGSAWAQAPCLRWIVGPRYVRGYLVQPQVQARLARLLVSHPRVF